MGTPSGDAPSVYNLLHRIWDVKDGSEKKGQYSISRVGKAAEQAQEKKEKTVRERMKRKGREYLAGVERKMVNSIAQKLNVPYSAKREKLMTGRWERR